MAVEPFAGHASAIVEGTSLALEIIIVRDDDAAFAGRHQLAGLEAECGTDAERPNLFTAPLAAVGMCRIFHECDPVLLRDLLQAVEVGGMTSHVHSDDGLRAWSDCSFGQVWI